MAKKPSFGSNFKPRASVGEEAKITKNIGIGTFSQQDKEELRKKLNSTTSNIIEETVDFSTIIPNADYEIKKVQRSKLKPAPDEWNFFSKPTKDKLIIMAESIHKNGLLQPIIVREMNESGSSYQILAGHTRNEAYGLLFDTLDDTQYLEIEAIVFKYGAINDSQAEDIVCDTNFMQRGNLPPREMAKCVFLKTKKLKENYSYGSGSIAQKIAEEYKIKKTSVFMWQRLANLIDEIQDLVESRKITLKNAYVLAALDKDSQLRLVKECSNFISNESIKSINIKDPIDKIIETIENNYGITYKSVRYEVSEAELKNPKDEPILVYVNKKQKEELLSLINNSGIGYIVRS